MHEMTLAIQAIRTVLEFAEENRIQDIDTVVLEIGELSMIVPAYLEESWNAAVKTTALEGAKLCMDILPGNGICLRCGRVYNIVACQGVCPACGSQERDVLCGQEFSVKEILVRE